MGIFMGPLSFFCCSLLFFRAWSLPPAAIQVSPYLPNTDCDIENIFDQSKFGGQEVELAAEIVSRTGWNQTTYDVFFFCMPNESWYFLAYTYWLNEEIYGQKYLFTVYSGHLFAYLPFPCNFGSICFGLPVFLQMRFFFFGPIFKH